MAFKGVKALDGVTLEVHSGEILGLVGPNGSGKSTLVNVISGLLHPTAGQVLLDGQDLNVVPAPVAAQHPPVLADELGAPLSGHHPLEFLARI